MSTRYEELDSIRGIAALMVLLSHLFFIFPSVGSVLNSKFGLSSTFFWNGHSAVIIFFVLSGFVLSLPFYKYDKPSYVEYIIKRVCRIYIPYIVIVAIAIVFKMILQPKIGTIPGLVNWGLWSEKVSFHNILNHILFINEFNSDSFVMVVWSLVHEMRISIIFPFIVLLLVKLKIKLSILLAIILSFFSVLLIMNFPTKFNIPVSTNYFITLHYISMFIIGSLLAKSRHQFINNIYKMKVFITLIGIVFFYFPGIPFKIVSMIVGEVNYTVYQMVIDWIISIGAASLIILVLNSRMVSKILLIKPIKLLGKISYSLYLVHPVVLLTMVHILYGFLPIPFILFVSFILSLLLSWLSYKYIEYPSIKFGKYLSKQRNANSIMKQEASA
jgi:peptidoglycan/LPS O-acetylase OafA/YrhL